MPEGVTPKHGGYRKLKSFQVAWPQTLEQEFFAEGGLRDHVPWARVEARAQPRRMD